MLLVLLLYCRTLSQLDQVVTVKILGYTKATNSIVPGSGRVLGVKVANIGEYVAARSDGGSPAKTEYHRSSGSTWSSLGKAALLGGKIRTAEYNFGAGDFIHICRWL